MENFYLKPKQFTGSIGIEGHTLDVTFTAGIDMTGEVVIDFERFERSLQSAFIADYFHAEGMNFPEFKLVGSASDGTTFSSDNIIFTSLGNQFSDTFASLSPVAACTTAKFAMTGSERDPTTVKWLLKGYEGFRSLKEDTPLGTVGMLGVATNDLGNQMSGRIQISANKLDNDLGTWRGEVDQLFARIRHVMSFAAGTMLSCPIVETIHDGVVTVETFSQAEQPVRGMGPFSSRNQDAIFQYAIKSHFAPAFDVQNLHFAITWFVMHNPYAEANLISAMTVLENLISSNLNEDETLLRPDKEFKKLRKKLRGVVKEEVLTWTENEAAQCQFVSDFDEKFGDLNRRSLKQKTDILARRWGVNLDGVEEEKIQAAKKARDLIVHRGSYQPKPGSKSDLFDHVLITRELVVRFILTALQFDGRYYSFVDGYHETPFLKGIPS